MRVSTDGPGAYHTTHAQRHLGKHCNKLSIALIEKRTNDKKEGSKYDDEVIVKTEKNIKKRWHYVPSAKE